MSRKSNDTLIDELSRTRRDLMEIARDPDWSGQNDVLTRRAAHVFLPRVAEEARWVVVIRFPLPSFPFVTGGAFTTPRRALNLRAPEVLMRVRWETDEALLVLSDIPSQLLGKIVPILRNDGLTFSVGFTPYSGNLELDHARATTALHVIKESEEE